MGRPSSFGSRDHILLTIASLALLLGIFWIVNGAVEAFTALVYGVMEIVLAFRLRSVGRATTRVAPAT